MLMLRILLLEISVTSVSKGTYYYFLDAMLYHNYILAALANSWSTMNFILHHSLLPMSFLKLFVLNFCFIENVWVAPLLVVNTPSMWIFISACTAKAASAYQSTMVILLIFNVSLSSCFSWTYLIIHNNLFQLSSSGPLNLVHNNGTAGLISGLSFLHRNNY